MASKSSNNGHWLICVLNIDEQYSILANIYGFNNPAQNKLLLTELSDNIKNLKLTYPHANAIVGGDYNMVYDERLDRYPSKCQHSFKNPYLISVTNSENFPFILGNYFTKIKLAELNLIKEINIHCNKESPTDNDKQKLLTLQTKLDEIYLKKAGGAYIRSRAKWIEDGERSTAYFCRLEKRRQEGNSIKTLLIQNQLCTDPTLITTELTSFYSKLYSSAFSAVDSDSFFNHIKDLIPCIEDDFAELCEADITIFELDKAVDNLFLNKFPGCDGLTSNFYQHFWDLLKKILLFSCYSHFIS